MQDILAADTSANFGCIAIRKVLFSVVLTFQHLPGLQLFVTSFFSNYFSIHLYMPGRSLICSYFSISRPNINDKIYATFIFSSNLNTSLVSVSIFFPPFVPPPANFPSFFSRLQVGFRWGLREVLVAPSPRDVPCHLRVFILFYFLMKQLYFFL